MMRFAKGDLLFVAWNRLEFTRLSFDTLIANTNWKHINKLFVHDDGSEDGTAQYLAESMIRVPLPETQKVFHNERLGGPVAAMNWYFDNRPEETEFYIKVDNDYITCPGWLEDILTQEYLHPEVDIMGTEPMHGPPAFPPYRQREMKPAEWIGGKGLIRHRSFTYCRPTPSGPKGRRGFTEYQHRHKHLLKAWIVPDLPCFGLDQLDFEPWKSLTEEYIRKGWQRGWNKYEDSMYEYWSWMFPDWESQKAAA